MAIAALLLGWLFDLPMFARGDVVLWRAVLMGAAIGAATVGLSQLITTWTSWGKSLGESMSELIGPQSVLACVVMALCSSIGEELFFRGFLQQCLERKLFSIWFDPQVSMVLAVCFGGILFGAMHIGPDRKKYLPWTLMAIVMGWVFGWSFVATKSLVAPIVAHFAINAINLTLLSRQLTEDDQ